MEAAQSSAADPFAQQTPGAESSEDRASGASEATTLDDHPEILVGAAFAGGLALAGVLRWLGR